MVNESTLRRLAFIKHLFSLAVDQSRQPEPIAATSILMFHDSVELFLVLAAEVTNADSGNKTDFMGYFGALKESLGRDLEQREAMKRLNNARVALKHHGTLPAHSSVEGFRVNSTSFFEQNMPLIFNIEFSAVSLSYLVEDPEIRLHIDQANEAMQQRQYKEAMAPLAVAYTLLSKNYRQQTPRPFGRFDFRNLKSNDAKKAAQAILVDPRKDQRFSMHVFGQTGAEDFFVAVTEAITNIQNILEVLAQGIDYRDYIQFQSLVPKIYYSGRGDDYGVRYSEDMEYSQEQCQFCFDFVIRSAIILQSQ